MTSFQKIEDQKDYTPVLIRQSSWPLSQLGEAMERLAGYCSINVQTGTIPLSPPCFIERELRGKKKISSLRKWIENASSCLGLEALSCEVTFQQISKTFCQAGPAIFLLPYSEEEISFLAILPTRQILNKARVMVSALGPDQKIYQLPLDLIQRIFSLKAESLWQDDLDQVLKEAGLSQDQNKQIRSTMLKDHLGQVPVTEGWLIRLPASGAIRSLIKQARLTRNLLSLFMAYTIQYLLFILSWWVIGWGTLRGHLEMTWVLAWALLLLTMVPFQMLATWSQGLLIIHGGGLLKQRLLYGALQLQPEEISHQGAGQLLSRVMESEAVESLALSSGFLGLAALIEGISAGLVITLGIGGGIPTFLFLFWAGLILFFGYRYYRQRLAWTQHRLEMTHDLVEKMVGHRTRLAQELPEQWHEGEDKTMAQYLGLSSSMDQKSVILTTLIPGSYLTIGLLSLCPAFLAGQISASSLAVGLGGLLLGHRALTKLPTGLMSLSDLAIAWQQISILVEAARRGQNMLREATRPLCLTNNQENPNYDLEYQENQKYQEYPMIEAHNLIFRYSGRSLAVIPGCSFKIRPGEHLLLEGPSGGGKSTLASLLTGLRTPENGLLLLKGLDLPTLGSETWRQQVACAPQFHENHILTGSLAFNLLMGCHWPPKADDLQEAESLCRELGLGPLLDHMPAGLMQIVGDTGWQLSHGEKSRIFIARALLQKAALLLLDESLAALDPATLQHVLQCILKRAQTLLIIAHP